MTATPRNTACTPQPRGGGKHSLRLAGMLAVALLAACGKKDGAPVVAEWQDIRITLSDFERSYFTYWQTTSAPDSPELRRTYARLMIEQELIVRSRKENKAPAPPVVIKRLQRDHERFARRRYLEVMLKDTLTAPTTAEVELALARQNQQLRVRQLFAPTRAQLEALAARLQAGEPFERVARATLPDSARAARGGDLGWIGWGDTDLPVEEVLYSLKPGAISPPVQSLMGWHLFRVDSVRTTIRFGEVHPLLKEEISLRLLNRRFDMAAALHLRELVWSKDLVVNMKVLREVWDYLAPMLGESTPTQLPMRLLRISEQPPRDLSREIAATVAGTPFTVAEFLESLPDLPRDLLRPDLKKALEVAIRDRIVTEHALAAGFGEDPVVREKTRRAEIQYEYYAALAARDTLPEDEASLRSFYENNRHRYVARLASEINEILVADADSARALAKALHAGADFADMARRHSRRDSTKFRAGYLGYVDSKANALGAQAATLREGDLYAPVATAEGYSVIRVGRKQTEYEDFDEIKERVTGDARQHRMDVLHRTLLPPEYDPGSVRIHEENLQRALQQRGTVF